MRYHAGGCTGVPGPDCTVCAEGDEDGDGRCHASKRACGHHCNHWWSHESCCWCSGRDEYGRVPLDESRLTIGEKRALDLTADLVGALAELPVLHPADAAETTRDIHDIQNRILARVCYPEAQRRGKQG